MCQLKALIISVYLVSHCCKYNYQTNVVLIRFPETNAACELGTFGAPNVLGPWAAARFGQMVT